MHIIEQDASLELENQNQFAVMYNRKREKKRSGKVERKSNMMSCGRRVLHEEVKIHTHTSTKKLFTETFFFYLHFLNHT